ncbi:MAG TPA: hypothetical protein VNA20_01870 [Frankiaceae bacterium]|nr:hypothetical protein [Frankiaceae bacterium]
MRIGRAYRRATLLLVSDPYGVPPEPPAERSRLGCAVALFALFVLGFVGVLALLFLRAPDGGHDAPAESGLTRLLREPPGYAPLPDAGSGGGPLSEGMAATALGRNDVPGFADGVLRAWGRGRGEPPRAVVVLAVEVGTPDQALELRRGYVARALDRGATPFATPFALDAAAFHDQPDASERHAQRVVLTRENVLFVVSVVTQSRERDTSEVVRLATAQAAVV